MDAIYEWACTQAGVQLHPRLLREFAKYSRQVENVNGSSSAKALMSVGVSHAKAGNSKNQPVQDADVVAVSLVLQTLMKNHPLPLPVAVTRPSLVHLDLSGEPVTCVGARTLAAVLQVDCGIRILILRSTQVGNDGAAALGASLSASALEELDLGACKIGDTGISFFARGFQLHGAAARLAVLLLDGNLLSDVAAADMIALLEGPHSPPALAVFSLHPLPPRAFSVEVDAALRVVCAPRGIELRQQLPFLPSLPGFTGHSLGPSATASVVGDSDGANNSMLASSSILTGMPQQLPSGHSMPFVAANDATRLAWQRNWHNVSESMAHLQPSLFATSPAQGVPLNSASALPGASATQPAQTEMPSQSYAQLPTHLPAGIFTQGRPSAESVPKWAQAHMSPPAQPTPPHTPPTGYMATSSNLPNAASVLSAPAVIAADMPTAGVVVPTPGRSSRHLAEWMAGTERELRELKWLFGASIARLDGQHALLMQELDKFRKQIDVWATDSSSGGPPAAANSGSTAADDARLEAVEARFDALEKLVGREQTECLQMWQLVEAAAGMAGASVASGTPNGSSPPGGSSSESK